VYIAEYCLYIFLFLGSEGGHGTVPPVRTLVTVSARFIRKKVTNINQAKVTEHGKSKWNISSRSLCEDRGILHYCEFTAEGLTFFLLVSISRIQGKVYVTIWYKFYSFNKLFYCTINIAYERWALERILPGVFISRSMTCCQGLQNMPCIKLTTKM